MWPKAAYHLPSQPMITRLHVQNFKSLRDIELELGPLNVLVGPNMSGKSNILDALRFFHQITFPEGGAQSVGYAIAQHGGMNEALWKGDGSVGAIGTAIVKVLSLSVDVRQDVPPNWRFKYELEITAGAGDYASLSRESLRLVGAREEAELTVQKQGTSWIKSADGRELGGIGSSADTALRHASPNWEGYEFQQWIRGWRFYHLIPPAMKQSVPVSKGQTLDQDGSNLSAWLMWLQAHSPEAFGRISEVLSDLFPEITSLKAIPTADARVFLVAAEKGLKRATREFQLSDGFLALTALLSLIYAPPELSGSLLCVEEPENHLHPRLMETLVALLRQAQQEVRDSKRSPTQIILTTQSPYLVDQFSLDEVIWVEKKEGETKASRPSSKTHLKKLVEDKELGLGDLMYTGALGDEK